LARRMLEDVRLFQDGAGDLKTLRRGVLRVAAPQLMACTWVAGVLAQFGQDFPDIGVRLVDGNADDVVAAVRRGDAELGIGPERPVGDDVTRSFLMNVPMRVICARTHRLAQRKVVAWHELGSERWVVYSSEFNRHLEQLLHMHDGSLTLQTTIEVEYLTTALALVGASTGIAAVPDYAHSFASNFGLHFLTVQAPSLYREYFVYQRRGLVLSPPAQEFAERLRCRALA
jgi:DNA-binding transcriptional LysR family regulator